MGTTIVSLPPELHSQIFSELNPFDVEAVAKTFNRKLHHLAMPLLTPHVSWIRNARSMCSRFPPAKNPVLMPSFPGHIGPFQRDWTHSRVRLPRDDIERLALTPARGPLVRCSPPDLRSWLKMDGSFGWLEPLDDEMAGCVYPYTGAEGDHPVAHDRHVDAVVKYAERFGLTLPQGFETFMRSDRLHHRMPSFSAWYFELSRVMRCPPSIDKGAGGHILRFYSDQQHCAFAYLYMDTSGNHCVLYSPHDLFERYMDDVEVHDAAGLDDTLDDWARDTQAENEEEEEEEEEEVGSGQFQIVGLTFEEYLASVYFEELLKYEAKPFRGLVDFVTRVYRSPAAVEYMRGYNQAISDFLDVWDNAGEGH